VELGLVKAGYTYLNIDGTINLTAGKHMQARYLGNTSDSTARTAAAAAAEGVVAEDSGRTTNINHRLLEFTMHAPPPFAAKAVNLL
jgi:hypothetical protein